MRVTPMKPTGKCRMVHKGEVHQITPLHFNMEPNNPPFVEESPFWGNPSVDLWGSKTSNSHFSRRHASQKLLPMHRKSARRWQLLRKTGQALPRRNRFSASPLRFFWKGFTLFGSASFSESHVFFFVLRPGGRVEFPSSHIAMAPVGRHLDQ